MQQLVRCFVTSVILFAGALSARGADDFFFKANDRVLFLGDSITATSWR